MQSVIEAIETANPPLSRSQDHAASFMERVESLPAGIRKRIPAIYERSAIERRYSCVADFAHFEPERFEFFPKDWSLSPAPSTEFRNEWYRKSIIPLMEESARKAMASAKIEAGDVTHIITVSCTGFFAPGPDVEMVKRLGLSPSTHRTMIGFMGCFAAFNALRVADAFCRSSPDAVVLVICAELCTLHFQVDDTLESAVVNALFSDGAASAIMRSRRDDDRITGLAYRGSHSVLDDDSMGDMTWAVGDTGFMMGLSSRVPSIISKRLPEFVERLAKPIGGSENVGIWAIHPGGRAIVDKAQEVLQLDDADVRHSLAVLRDYGNMSSPTILFVLKRVMEDGVSNGRPGALAMAFGPGLTLEGAAFDLVNRGE
jgi:alpha-pyrone synthase